MITKISIKEKIVNSACQKMKTLTLNINRMNDHKILEINLKNNEIKIKEELQNFENEIKNENVSAVNVSSSALSYGEIFILQSDEGNPYLWWISCNICQEKFTGFENFLNHVSHIHLNKEPAKVLKTENENFYNENSVNSDNNETIYNINTDTQSEEDESFKIEEDAFANSDLNKLVKNGEKNKITAVLNIKSEKSTQKKQLLPRYCEICDKTFKRPAALRQHLKVHSKNDNKVYECKICHETFSQDEKRLYRNHRDRAHRKKIPCTLCEKTFKSKFYLDSHMMMHTGVKDFKCNHCSAEFYSKTSLSEHVRKKHLITKVPCRYCNKPFRPGSCLEDHIRIHTGEKPFVCEQCGSAFQTFRLLQSHIRRHNNDRRYECDVCGKKFFNNTYLRDHKVTHTDEKPYGCDNCNARFNSRPALIKHKNLHSGVKKYQCKICGKAYAQSPGLYAHMKSHNIADEKLLKFSLD